MGAELSEARARQRVSSGRFGALIAMGFTPQSETVFLPFVATVLAAVFVVIGVLTVLR
jgi:hypothetical protein